MKHRAAITAFALSPCGRYLASGSETPVDDYAAGGSLVVWEVETGRALRVFASIDGGVGWSEYAGGLRWSASGRWLGAAFCTNVVGVFDPFAGEPFWCEAGVTGGWDSPPSWCFAPDDQRSSISAWGPRQAPGCVVSFAEGGSFSERQRRAALALGGPGERARAGRRGRRGRARRRSPALRLGALVETAPTFKATTVTARLMPSTRDRRCAISPAYDAPIAWSPDVRASRTAPRGSVFHDGRTGQATTDLPMIVGASEMVFSADGRRPRSSFAPASSGQADRACTSSRAAPCAGASMSLP